MFTKKQLSNGTPYYLSTSAYDGVSIEMEELHVLIGNYKGEVVFDLLITNGLATNRFIQGYFDGERLLGGDFEVIDLPTKEMINISREFYMEHTEIIENSILPNAHKFLIRHGRV